MNEHIGSLGYPDNVPVETPLGKVFLAVTSGDHVHIDGNCNGRFITVNGVDVTCSIHLNKTNGEWKPGYFYSTRKGSGGKDSSPAAKKKILAVVVPIVIDFLGKNPDLLSLGRKVAADSRRASLQAKILEKEKELLALRAELAGVEREEAAEPPFVG